MGEGSSSFCYSLPRTLWGLPDLDEERTMAKGPGEGISVSAVAPDCTEGNETREWPRDSGSCISYCARLTSELYNSINLHCFNAAVRRVIKGTIYFRVCGLASKRSKRSVAS
jgi:hypothetical protein